MRLFDSSILYWNDQQDAYSKAECYREGHLVKQSMPRALALYRQAAQQGDACAYFRLGQHAQAEGNMTRALAMYFQAGAKNHNEALSQLENLVAQNNAQAAIMLGKIFEQKKQYDIASKWYEKAHELKHPDGLYRLAQMHPEFVQLVHVLVNRYYESARLGSKYALHELVTRSVEDGKATHYLAKLYELGEGGLHQNKSRAIELYEKSSQQRCYEATYYLADLYKNGTAEFAADIPKACRYYLLASQQGHLSAMGSLTLLAILGNMHAQYVLGYEHYRIKNDISNAVVWCVEAEIQGHALAETYLLGTFAAEIYWKIASKYDSSTKNFKRNKQKAVEYAVKASNFGMLEAINYLAEAFQHGNAGIPADRQKSYGYYALSAKLGQDSSRQRLEQLAELGDQEAQYHLGYGYYREKNEIERATYWCVKAEIQGHTKAADYLSGIFTEEIYWQIAREYSTSPTSVRKCIRKAIDYASKASDLGIKEATFSLANIFVKGKENILIDVPRACSYFVLALQQGHPTAKTQLEALASAGNSHAQYSLGYEHYRVKNDIGNAVMWCVKAEIQGHAEAKKYLETTFPKEICWKISTCYTSEKNNLERNQQKALEYALEASDLGMKEASHYLAKVFYVGNESTPKDIFKSVKYFIAATKQGDFSALKALEHYAIDGEKEAQFSLAEYYRELKKDEISLRWFIQAEIQGHAQAKQTLKNNFTGNLHWLIATLYLEYEVTQEDRRWIYHCKKAAEKGNAEAAFYLAQQSEGFDFNQHRSEIVTRYTTAANFGNMEAQAATERLSHALIYASRNSGTLFSSSQSANAGSASQQALHSVQQKMKRK